MILLVCTTCPSRKVARQLADRIVSERLAACAQVGPAIESTYLWKGKKARSREIPVSFKTTREKLSKLQRAIAQNHPYEVPEMIAIKVNSGLPAYLKWVAQSLV